jgi:methionyl-tRNA formyltransferase
MADPSPLRRVVLLGKNALAVGCLEVLRAADAEVVLVVADPSDDGVDGWQPSLARAAEAAGIRVVRPERINAPATVEMIAALQPEIILSCQYAMILKPAVIGAASAATLNIHFGPLPRYRGVAPVYWAIANGEKETGVTLHHIDPGVDSGDILAARPVPIGPGDTARGLYERCTEAGVDLLRETWPRIARGELPRRPQDATDSLYYNRHSVDYDNRRLGWDRDCRVIADRARALIFPPFQYPTICLADRLLEVGAVDWDRVDHAGRPGEILGLDTDGLVVAAPGGRLRLGAIRADGEPADATTLTQLGARPGVILD